GLVRVLAPSPVSDLRQRRRLGMMNGSKPNRLRSIATTPRPRHSPGVEQTIRSPHPNPLPRGEYLFSGSGCRAATTPPRAAAERFARTAQYAASLCAAERGATRRSATSSTSLNTYKEEGTASFAPRKADNGGLFYGQRTVHPFPTGEGRGEGEGR